MIVMLIDGSTGPDQPGTHWYQCRLLQREPIAVNRNQTITGKLGFTANAKFSYDIALETRIAGTEISTNNEIKLHDQVSCCL
jgi:type I protein arginine methyltransferase